MSGWKRLRVMTKKAKAQKKRTLKRPEIICGTGTHALKRRGYLPRNTASRLNAAESETMQREGNSGIV